MKTPLPAPCRLLLVDDHPALTQGLAALFAQEPDLVVAGQFGSSPELLAFLEARPAPAADVLLLDLHLPPPLDGLQLLPQLRRGWPALRVLVFSSAVSGALVAQVAAAGAHGFLNKAVEADELLAAIRAVAAGQRVFPGAAPRPAYGGNAAVAHPAGTAGPGAATATAAVLLQLQRLTAREREIIGLVREGCSTRVMAARLSLSEYTVKTHRRNLLQKLGLHGVAELIRFALDHGL